MPPDIVFRLGLAAGPVTIVLGCLNLLFFVAYRLDRSRVQGIQAALEARRGSPRATGLPASDAALNPGTVIAGGVAQPRGTT